MAEITIQLFVSDQTSAAKVFERASLLCNKLLDAEHCIKVIDLSKNPAIRRDENIVATPCLRIKDGDNRVKSIVGDFSSVRFDENGEVISDAGTIVLKRLFSDFQAA